MTKLFDGEEVVQVDVERLDLPSALVLMGSTLVYTFAAKEIGEPAHEVDRGYLRLYDRVAQEMGADATAEFHARNSMQIILTTLQ
jgi:hypothetical protein